MASVHSRFNVFSQTFREARRPLLIWSALLMGVAWLLLLAYPLARDSLTGSLPEWAAIMLGVPREGAGLEIARAWWLAAAFNFALPVLMTLYAAWQGSQMMARDEERGSLGFLMSTPLPRGQLVVEKFAALLLLLFLPAVGVWLAGVLTGYFTPRPAFGLFLLGMAFGAPAFAIAAVTGRQMLSQNVVLVAALLTFLVDRLAEQLPAQAVLRLLSPFSYYSSILLGSGLIVPLIVLTGISLLAFSVGWSIFNQRDLHI